MSQGYGGVIGYYVWPDMFGPYCPECFHEEVRVPRMEAGQDPDSELDVPIFAIGHEADSPSHCTQCEELIPHDLTPDGIEYVREAMRALRDGDGRAEIVRQWRDYYLGGGAA